MSRTTRVLAVVLLIALVGPVACSAVIGHSDAHASGTGQRSGFASVGSGS
jgi:hypothetical protein